MASKSPKRDARKFPLTTRNPNDKENRERSFEIDRSRRAKLPPRSSTSRLTDPGDDAVARLMKLTVINNDYKRDLVTNQIVRKSNFGFDQVQLNPETQTEMKKIQNAHVAELQEIKNRKIRPLNNFLQNEFALTTDPRDKDVLSDVRIQLQSVKNKPTTNSMVFDKAGDMRSSDRKIYDPIYNTGRMIARGDNLKRTPVKSQNNISFDENKVVIGQRSSSAQKNRTVSDELSGNSEFITSKKAVENSYENVRMENSILTPVGESSVKKILFPNNSNQEDLSVIDFS